MKSCQDKHENIIHYLSLRAQNVFLPLCDENILKKILKERQKALYFSLVSDVTPWMTCTPVRYNVG